MDVGDDDNSWRRPDTLSRYAASPGKGWAITEERGNFNDQGRPGACREGVTVLTRPTKVAISRTIRIEPYRRP